MMNYFLWILKVLSGKFGSVKVTDVMTAPTDLYRLAFTVYQQLYVIVRLFITDSRNIVLEN